MRGDLIVALCRADKRIRFFDSSDLGVIKTYDVGYGGFWSEHGVNGFELIQVGNGYNVFFTTYQTGSGGAECEASLSHPFKTLIFNVSSSRILCIQVCLIR